VNGIPVHLYWYRANKYLTTEVEECRINNELTIKGTKHHFTICKSYTHCKVKRRRFWKYQRGNQNPYIEEEQTIQRPKEKVQKDKQRSTIHTHKA